MLSSEMKKQLEQFLKQDIGNGDVTSAVLPKQKCNAKIIAKESCTVAGLEEAKFLFNSKGVKAKPLFKDGSKVKNRATVMRLHGLNKGILSVERTALNVIGRMSEVATICNEAKKLSKEATIALTRKTMPGFNLFDKKAASLSGIWPHRTNLSSFVLLKDNHVPFFKSPCDAVLAARKKQPGMKVEVEVENLKQALLAAKARPSIIMLDNMPPKKAAAAIKKLRKVFSGKIELSGGINMKNLSTYAKAKPDIISMGSLTYATRWRDFSLKVSR
ncbi:MAG: carboxylating nicotinate-nucleotide diphosphorylase [Candidatus Diapherotrites archaeon]|uniref:Nicotinate-nucleotide pyrophosphorylase [carboxylating] n=1 Tax=Candidatus Iainarchaeum sp. TaxID=3101447 RepID=A0A938YTP9_9ARCH|nr:carboxylating nicotinate-nucleotide diphosphorylase [Candidatus Diapherotrites archaeon]